MCSFLILSVLVISKENLYIFSSATSSCLLPFGQCHCFQIKQHWWSHCPLVNRSFHFWCYSWSHLTPYTFFPTHSALASLTSSSFFFTKVPNALNRWPQIPFLPLLPVNSPATTLVSFICTHVFFLSPSDFHLSAFQHILPPAPSSHNRSKCHLQMSSSTKIPAWPHLSVYPLV